MPCATIVGDELEFGVDEDELSLVTQSVSVVHKSDKKTARNKCGDVVSCAYYNRMSEITVTGLGIYDTAIGTAIAIAGSFGTMASAAAIVDEWTVDKANEEYTKSTVKLTAYSGITS